MDRVRIPRKSWVLVCDGSKALMLRNDGDAELLNLTTMAVFTEPHPATRDLGTDRPGRIYQSHGAARSSTEERDRHTAAETEFLSTVANELDKRVREHVVRDLILVAPPKALGVLRQRLTPAVRAVLTMEIAKDLAQLSTSEIEKHLVA